MYQTQIDEYLTHTKSRVKALAETCNKVHYTSFFLNSYSFVITSDTFLDDNVFWSCTTLKGPHIQNKTKQIEPILRN